MEWLGLPTLESSNDPDKPQDENAFKIKKRGPLKPIIEQDEEQGTSERHGESGGDGAGDGDGAGAGAGPGEVGKASDRSVEGAAVVETEGTATVVVSAPEGAAAAAAIAAGRAAASIESGTSDGKRNV